MTINWNIPLLAKFDQVLSTCQTFETSYFVIIGESLVKKSKLEGQRDSSVVPQKAGLLSSDIFLQIVENQVAGDSSVVSLLRNDRASCGLGEGLKGALRPSTPPFFLNLPFGHFERNSAKCRIEVRNPLFFGPKTLICCITIIYKQLSQWLRYNRWFYWLIR